jgi:hypothetical protein
MTDHQDRKLFTIVTTYLRYDSSSKEKRIDDSFIVNYNTAIELISSLNPESKDYKHQGQSYFITEVLSYGVYQKRITLEGLFDIASKELAEKREKYFPVVSGSDSEKVA